jgi:hypothetical protein
MRLTVNSYDGHTITDASYSAFIPLTERNMLSLAPSSAIDIDRGANFPYFGGKVLSGKNFIVEVHIVTTLSTGVETLKGWFDTRTNTLKKLVVTDADTTLQWSLLCTCLDMPKKSGSNVQFLMYAPDPVMKAESLTTVNWAITGTADTQAVTPVGNVATPPKFTFTPTAAKNGGFGYKKFCPVLNPQTTVAFTDYPYDLMNAGLDSAALVKVAAKKVQINNGAGIAIDAVTIPYDNETGTMPSYGMAYIDGATKEQISYTAKTATDLTGVTRGINGTTAAAHADDIWIYNSVVQADGDDIRVMVDGVEVSRWLSAMNSAATKVWFNISLAPAKTTKINAAIADSGAVTTIVLYYSVVSAKTKKKKTITNIDASLSLAFMNGIKSTGGLVMINNELFSYTGVNLTTYSLTGCTRAVKGTAMAAHSAQATITFVEHDIWLMYGNQDADAPYQDETKKPIINMDSSTNDSWVYADFWDLTGIRAGSWKPSVTQTLGRLSDIYGGDHATNADPAAVLGMAIKAFTASGKWKAETAILQWTLYHPAGITHVTSAGETYRNTTSWPLIVALQKGYNNGTRWVSQWNLSTPTVVSTRTAWSKAAEALGATFNYIKFCFSGSVGALLNAEADMEVSSCTLTIDSTKRPSCTVLAEQASYWMDAKITNNTTGEWMAVSYLMALNSTITVDCENKVAYYSDNTNILSALEFSSARLDWLNLLPGANELQFDDVGTDTVSGVIMFNSRNN